MINYATVCSGIEAPSVAWHGLGWKPVFFSEIEKFPCDVLKHHYPDVPNLGDMNNFKGWPDATIDLICGGTPCQSFSVAGLRKGLDDPRGNLAVVYLALVERYKPRWVVWENVPGVLSSNGGRDFGAFLGALGQLGYGWAYRVLDAQYFGVAQRRRRVFVVGCAGDWRSAAAVLFEPESLRGDIAPSRKAGQEPAASIGSSTCSGKPVFGTLMANAGDKQWLGNQEAFSGDYHVFGIPANWIGRKPENGPNQVTPTDNISPCLTRTDIPAVAYKLRVRKVMPVECERLQGFPDGYTNIPNAKDSPRYKALGNSMAVPVMRRIGERINQFEALSQNKAP